MSVPLSVDHVVCAVRDLAAAAARFEDELGLGSVEGGRHPAWGTANRIVPLGSAYIELTTVVDRARAAGSEFGRSVGAASARGDRLLAWSVATDDLDAIARRLGLEISRGSRTRPDGQALHWRLTGLREAMRRTAFPFFIGWEVPPELHPGRDARTHRVTPLGVAWVEVTGDAGELSSWLGSDDLPLRVGAGEPRLTGVGIATDDGEIVLR